MTDDHPEISQLERDFPAVAAAMTAMRRARLRAEELAALTGTDLIFAVDGRPVRVAPRAGFGSGIRPHSATTR